LYIYIHSTRLLPHLHSFPTRRSSDLMWSYYELLTDRTPKEIASLEKEVSGGTLHAMDAKMRLAEEVISDFHGKEAGRKAAEHFQRAFRDRQAPEEAPTVKLPTGSAKKPTARLDELKLAESKAEAERDRKSVV